MTQEDHSKLDEESANENTSSSPKMAREDHSKLDEESANEHTSDSSASKSKKGFNNLKTGLSAEQADKEFIASSSFLFFWVLGILLTVVDIMFRLMNSSYGVSSTVQAVYLWVVFGLLVFFSSQKFAASGEKFKLFFIHFKRVLVSVLFPLIAFKLFPYLIDYFSASGVSRGLAISNSTLAYATLIIYLFIGYPGYLIGGGSVSKYAVIRFLSGLLSFLLIAFVTVWFVGALISSLSASTDVLATSYGVPSFSQLYKDFITWFNQKSSAVISYYNRTITGVTQPYYTGQVDRSVPDLGVQLKPPRPLLNFYDLEVKDQDLVPIVDDVVWTGVVSTKSFADDLVVKINCSYRKSDKVLLSYPARPETMYVPYSGGFLREQDYTCQVPLSEVLLTDPSVVGSFITYAEFGFQTWGYSTVLFIDANLDRELRQQRKNPAIVLGVPPVIEAKYTSGPVKLGMFDKLTQPLTVDVDNPSRNTLPLFGVTLSNNWVGGLGDLKKIYKLIFQVPEPFVLDVDDCIGFSDSAPSVHTSSYDGEDIKPGFTWYVWEDIDFSDSKSFSFKTVLCPMRPRDDRWSEVLGPDLSPRFFTFVARVEYEYGISVNVPVRIRRVSV